MVLMSIDRASNFRFGSLADLWTHSSLMSAFPKSGRSDGPKFAISKGRFRPRADISCDDLRLD